VPSMSDPIEECMLAFAAHGQRARKVGQHATLVANDRRRLVPCEDAVEPRPHQAADGWAAALAAARPEQLWDEPEQKEEDATPSTMAASTRTEFPSDGPLQVLAAQPHPGGLAGQTEDYSRRGRGVKGWWRSLWAEGAWNLPVHPAGFDPSALGSAQLL